MLMQLTMNHFTIVDHLTLDYHQGMTAITGETGAGKSIAIDAIHLCLGARSDSQWIRSGCERTDISAHFTLDDTPSALAWLKHEQLDEGNECIIRRVISRDGRSKAFINGQPVTLSQLKIVGQLLIQIHGQHAYQRLLEPHYQMQLLDNYLDQPALFEQLATAVKKWQHEKTRYKKLLEQQQESKARQQLLQYQLQELNEFAPIAGEYEANDEEYRRLSHSEQLIAQGQQLLNILDEEEHANLRSLLNQAQQITCDMQATDAQCADLSQLIDNALIQINEAYDNAKHYVTSLDVDLDRVNELNQRITKQIALARKHSVKPEHLPDLYLTLQHEVQQMNEQEESLETIEQSIALYHCEAMALAQKAHQKRSKQAKIISELITEKMRSLAMPHAQFHIEILWNEELLSVHGADQVIFTVCTNPGQPLQPIAKVASGGELSRIALVIHALIAKKLEMPALIFDEIDTGISGATAAKVGHLLKELGQSTQVIAVTHLPQVAGYADHHYVVHKKSDGKTTTSTIEALNEEERIEEIARLLAGDKVTSATLANAKELLVA